VRFNFERGKSCRYSTYTYSKQLGEFLRVGEGGGAWPTPAPLNPPLGGGDNWTTGAISHAKLQSNHHHQQTNIQFFYRPVALPVTQPTVSKH